MIRLGVLVPLLAQLGADKPPTREVSQVPSALCVKQPKEIPFDVNFMPPLGILQLPRGPASRSACKSAVICRASISTKPEPFMPIVFLSLVALSIVTNFPDSSTAPRVAMPSL